MKKLALALIAALLLLLVGVSREDIVSNYSVTYDLIRPIVDPKIALMPAQTHHILRSDAENMELFLDYFDSSGNWLGHRRHTQPNFRKQVLLQFQLG